MIGKSGDAGMIEITGKVVVVALALLLFVAVFVFCLHFYATWCWFRRDNTTAGAGTTRRRRRFDFAAGQQEITAVSALRRGLDPSVLKTIPILVFKAKELKDGLECAVCLCEVTEGEKARILPKCNHGFHVDCIDMWFQSHSTCPLCRNPIDPVDQNQPNFESESPLETVFEVQVGEDSRVDFLSREARNFPTNVLVWGDETRVITLGPCVEESHQSNANAESSSSSSSSSFDVPRQINEEEEQKSSVPTRLRSLKRLLSGTRRVNPSSPRNLDIEQGQG